MAVVFGGEGGGHFERGEHVAGVAVGAGHEVGGGVVVDGEVVVTEASRVLEGPVDELAERVGPELLEAEQARARQERSGEREEGVLGGGADQHEEAFLDVRKEGVLLGAVEAVDLVEEEDGALAVLPEPAAGPRRDVADVLDAGADRRERLEGLAGRAGDEAGDGGLAGPGWAPQHDRGEPVGFDQRSERLPRAEQLGLADDLVEAAGAQAGRERRALGQSLLDGGAEQVGHAAMVRRTSSRKGAPPWTRPEPRPASRHRGFGNAARGAVRSGP